MNTLEVIHLRMCGDDLDLLVNTVQRAVEEAADPPEIRIYRHARIEGDLLLHLHWDVSSRGSQFSELGLRLASLLRFHGMVEHSVWVRAGGMSTERKIGQ